MPSNHKDRNIEMRLEARQKLVVEAKFHCYEDELPGICHLYIAGHTTHNRTWLEKHLGPLTLTNKNFMLVPKMIT
jgi:hypothetical protein